MALDARCWECRRRRVHCDFVRPSCTQCSSKARICPGYSSQKPLKWRHRIQTSSQSPESPQSGHETSNDAASLPVADDIMNFYNTRIAPDNSPDARNTYYITPADWATFGKLQRHLYTCIVLLHKIVQGVGSKDADQELLLQHQTAAAREMYEMIRAEDPTQPPNPKVCEGASMFLCSQIQYSAFGAWRMHLNGAKSLVHPWRDDNLGRFDFALFHIIMVDIYGTTTMPSSMMNKQIIEQHRTYARIIGRLDVDPLCTLIPIPIEVTNAVIAINIHRAKNNFYDVSLKDCPEEGDISLLDLMKQLQAFDSESWAHSLASENARSARSWVLLATCYRSAAILYLSQSTTSKTSIGGDTDLIQDFRRAAHRACVVAITEILHQKEQKGTHYKFIMWPMVICGIESAALGQRLEVQFLCQALEKNTIDLGTNTHHDAAGFLRELWMNCEEHRPSKESPTTHDWDDICAGAPIFLM